MNIIIIAATTAVLLILVLLFGFYKGNDRGSVTVQYGPSRNPYQVYRRKRNKAAAVSRRVNRG